MRFPRNAVDRILHSRVSSVFPDSAASKGQGKDTSRNERRLSRSRWRRSRGACTGSRRRGARRGELDRDPRASYKRYGEYEAVRGMDHDGEDVARCSGCSGPTAPERPPSVEILEGYRRRTSGEVSASLDEDPCEMAAPSSFKRRIGDRVAGSAGMYGHITPREALRHWAGLLPPPAGCRLRRSQLVWPAVRRRTYERGSLSGGQLRRLDFALALVGDPELIFSR